MKQRIIVGIVLTIVFLAIYARFDGDRTQHQGPPAKEVNHESTQRP